MSGQLSKFIEPLRLVRDHGHLQGKIPLSGMLRLAESVQGVEGEAMVDLGFGIDEAGLYTMTGKIQAEVKQLCQRCMGSIAVVLRSDVSIGIVRNREQALKLPEHLEPLLVESTDPVLLADIVEDELLLALPLVPRHEKGDQCIKLDEYQSEEDVAEKPNPFAVLAALKKQD